MDISLPTRLDEFVKQQVQNGAYYSEREVVEHALELLRDWHVVRQSRLSELRKEVAIGIEQIKRGECKEYDNDSLDELFQEIRNSTLTRFGEQRPG